MRHEPCELEKSRVSLEPPIGSFKKAQEAQAAAPEAEVMRTVPRSESGFTLIELVIVIVILGILASVAIPKYEDMREQARTATLKGQVGSVRSALSIQYARSSLNGAPAFRVLNGTIFADGNVPKEPVLNSNAVKVSTGIDNAGGWQYTQATGMVKANLNAYSSY